MGGQSVAVRIDLPPLPVPLLEGTGRLAARIRLAGGAHLREARATVLTHEDMRATNTFDRPDEVAPAALAVPKQSVVAVLLELA